MQKFVNVFSKLFFIVLLFLGFNFNTYGATGSTVCTQTGVTNIPESECIVLQEMYTKLDGDNWINNTNWNTLSDVNTWYGINVRNGHVADIQLSNNNLSGEFPQNLHLLPELIYVHVINNNLYGYIPTNAVKGGVHSSLTIRGNKFEIADLKDYLTRTDIRTYYNPQQKVDKPNFNITSSGSIKVLELIPTIADTSGNNYVWYKDGVKISTSRVYTKFNVTELDSGKYYYLAYNHDVVRGVVLRSKEIDINGLIAGEITVLEFEPSTDALLEGDSHTIIGKIQITNVGGENLSLKEFGLNTNVKGYKNPDLPYCEEDDLLGSILGTCIELDSITLTGSLTNSDIFNRIDIFDDSTGKGYIISDNSINNLLSLSPEEEENLLYNSKLNIPLKKGANTFTIIASVKDDISHFDKASIQLSFKSGKLTKDGGLYIINNDNNLPVTDITPSSITFDRLQGVDNSNRPLCSLTKEVTGIPESECEVLQSLYFSTNGHDWTNNTNWNTMTHVANWHGIKVRNGHVTEIQLSNNNLSGEFPQNLYLLPELTYVHVINNDLYGYIPTNALKGGIHSSLTVRGNKFEIADLKDYLTRTDIRTYYNPQQKLDKPEINITSSGSVKVLELTPTTLDVEGSNYIWYKDGVKVGTSRIYTKYNASNQDVGEYYYVMYNHDKVRGLTLTSQKIKFNTLSAGEVYVIDIPGFSGALIEGGKNVGLGSIEITNAGGKNLELREFALKVNLNPGEATVNINYCEEDDLLGSILGTCIEKPESTDYSTGTVDLTVKNLFKEVTLHDESNGYIYNLYDVSDSNAPLSFDDSIKDLLHNTQLDILLKEGTNRFQIRADVSDNIDNFDTASIQFSLVNGKVSKDGGLYIVNTDNNLPVTDITPSSITFDRLYGVEKVREDNKVDVISIDLGDISVVRGSDNVLALQFQVGADMTNDLVVDEIVTKITMNSGTTFPATLNEIAKISLYKDSISDSNLIDTEAGSQLSINGEATFDNFTDIDVASNSTQTFIVTLDFVDGVDAVDNSDYTVALTSIDIQDSENDDVFATGLPLNSNSFIKVNGYGKVTITEDDNNQANRRDKTVLAGTTSDVVFSVDVKAENEGADVEDVVFTVEGASGDDIKNSIVNASLYLDDVLIETNVNRDIVVGTSISDNTQSLTVFTTIPNVVGTTTIREVRTLTPSNVEVGDVFSANIAGQYVSYTATTPTVSNVVSGLTSMINSNNNITGQGISAVDNGTIVTLTGNVNGDSFSITGISATNVASVAQVDIVTLSGSLTNGATYQITIDGVPYKTVSVGISGSSVATSLAALVNNHSNVSATATGETITIVGMTSGNSFTTTATSTTGSGIYKSTITSASSGVNNQSLNSVLLTAGVVGVSDVAQVSNLTPTGTIEVGDTFTATINGIAVSYVATSPTVSNVVSGLASAINSNGIVNGLVTAVNNGTTVIITSDIAGTAFTIAGSTTNIGSTSNGTISFKNMNNLIIPETTSELRLVLNTAPIGFQKVGKTIKNLTVTKVELREVTGEDSGKDLNDEILSGISSKNIIIVPAIINPTVVTSLNSSATPEIRLSADVGYNTKDYNNSESNLEIESIKFSTSGTSTNTGIIYKLINLDDSSDIITGTVSGNILTFNTVNFNFENKKVIPGIWETFRISIEGTQTGDNVSLKLLQDGITYNVIGNAGSDGLKINMDGDLDLGSRSY